MAPKPRRLSSRPDPSLAADEADDRWQMWLPGFEHPLEHRALSSLPAALHRKPSLDQPSVPPPRVIAVISDRYGAQATRTLRDEGTSEVIAWSWRLPERVAAELETDGIGVVFGYHTEDDLEVAQLRRRGAPDPMTAQLAELEEIAGLDSEAA